LPGIDQAAAAVDLFNTSFAHLCTSVLKSGVLIFTLLLATSVGSAGVQKTIRQIVIVIGVCALVDGVIGVF
jgi:hypothetical protein